MIDLSEKQIQLFNEIKKYIDFYGFPPSIRELCELMNVNSTGTIQPMLERLKRKGYIDFMPRKSRTIRILKEIN